MRLERQKTGSKWAAAAFGREQASHVPHRCVKLAEEVDELCQAGGVDEATMHRLVRNVYRKPAGDIRQEIGGVGLTLLVLGEAVGVDVDEAEIDELSRVLAKPIEHFAERNRAKNESGSAAPEFCGARLEEEERVERIERQIILEASNPNIPPAALKVNILRHWSPAKIAEFAEWISKRVSEVEG